MTSPMVDTVRNIPLRVERGRVPMDAEMRDETGFPFDDREARGGDDAFQSQLDDLAKRHPEFAEHFGSFPFREGGSSSRPRREHPEFRRFADRPFGQRFERFGFPGRDLFHENYPNGSTSQEQPTQSQQQPQPHQAEATHPEAAATSAAQPPKQEEAASKPPEVPQENRRRQQNIQQSNTVDLGQKQEPVNDRNQRSMSAPPPDSRGGQQRFVSSIQIPINSGGMGDMGGQQSTQEKPTQTPQQHSQPQQQQQHQPQQQQDKASKPMERVIPIHVEGRDEPVMPKHGGPTFAQQQHQPQPETIFGQRPGKFTQYVPRQFGQSPFEEPMRQQQQHYQPQQQQKFQQQQQKPAAPAPQRASPQPQPQPQPQAAPQPQQQPQRQQTPPQQPKPQTPINIIQSIQKDVSELMSQVEKFAGQPRDKQYLYLDEMLTRNLLKLDNVDTQGQENIRSARKEAIRCIERCIGVLEAKAAANVPQSEQMEVETKAETQSEEIKPECSSEEAKPETPSQEQMEVVASAEKPADEPQAPKAEEESMEVADEPDKKKKSKQKKSANE